jgi:hypothetical protein
VAHGHIRHSCPSSPPELTHVWQGYPAPSYDLSHQHILTSHGREEINVVQEFPNLFPDDLSGMPLERAIKFNIE